VWVGERRKAQAARVPPPEMLMGCLELRRERLEPRFERLKADSRPLEPCPSCLAKLCHAVGCDPVKRFDAIEAFWRDRPRHDTLDYARAARAQVQVTAASRPDGHERRELIR
jgi:hypothetical protein